MKRIVCMLLCAAMLLWLSGCSLWMDGSYHSVEPHQESDPTDEPGNLEASNYGQLLQAMGELVENVTENGIIYVTGFTEDELIEYGKNAADYIRSNHPIGAYAVTEISCDVGTAGGNNALAVNISYSKKRADILRIQYARSSDQAMQWVIDALEQCQEGVVFRVSEMDRIDYITMIREHVDSNPDTCMEQPQVNVIHYPEKGTEQVVEVTFSYQSGRENLRNMQKSVESLFSAAELYVRGSGSTRQKLSQLYTFLMERFDYTVEPSVTPSYSLLTQGIGDSKAFATVYAAMCHRADLECQVVAGTKDGAAHYWNAIPTDGTYLHVDLLECNKQGGFYLSESYEMTGYVWDYSVYPLEEPPLELTEPTVDETTSPEN